MIPLYYTKPTLLFSEDESKCTKHPNAVHGKVYWPVTEADQLMGIEDEYYVFRFLVQPEVRLPKKDKEGRWVWSQGDAIHLFWLIQRQTEDTDKWNVELIETEVTMIAAAEFDMRVRSSTPMTDCIKAVVPCIVNTKDIDAGEQVILKMALQPKPKAKAKQNGRAWVETIQQQEGKRRKTSQPTVVG